MELQLDRRLAESMELGPLSQVVLGCNMDVYTKIQTLRTILSTDGIGTDLRKEYDAALKQMLKLAEDRNKVAHWPASEDEKTGGVRFTGFKTKGKFALDSMVWSVEETWAKYNELVDLAEQMKKYADEIKVRKKAIAPIREALLKRARQ